MLAVVALAVLALAVAGCGSASHTASRSDTHRRSTPSPPVVHHHVRRPPTPNVYRADAANEFSPAVRGDPVLVYVPNSLSNTVDVISQKTMKVIRTFPTGALPQHVTPSYDLKTLYVDNDEGNSLTPINPRTGQAGSPIPVSDPYNLYFTPNGKYAIVVAERLHHLDFSDPHTMALEHVLSVPQCAGVDHMDFSANGRYAYASCEFSGAMIVVDLQHLRVVQTLRLRGGNAMPQDVKLSPDGRILYVADMRNNGVWEFTMNPRLHLTRFQPTGAGAHGLYPSRNARELYVSNRAAGTISVISFDTRKIIATWHLPQPASPDMGGVSADGATLWLSGRYNGVVYAINTRTGHLRATIPVGDGPHGLCVWPQPGRHSLGHTGILR